ncbi:hypothetical protein [Variovorax sp. CY25R-8]|uniref:hypothetical protein n=1 Tax=Variovorax sp. CY25R-8 TaxID=2855501 RepID=UPI0021BB395E|nr:hypothetical protein [Variovorax sp. CY25R-8]MCT8174350.1 hypothetical protein [Variovorax sp. CY25R-8]
MIHLATDQGSPAEPIHKSIEVQGKTLEFTYTEGSNVFAGISLEWMLLLIGEIERLRKISAAICIDFKQASDILSMFGGEPGEITLQLGEGHSGRGLYVHYSDYPEEGAEFLGVADEEAMPVADGNEAAEPVAYLLTRPSGFAWSAMAREMTSAARAAHEGDGVCIEPLVRPPVALQGNAKPTFDREATLDELLNTLGLRAMKAKKG